MLISRNREKLINAIVFFAQNTEACGKIKLFKLLYLLDFDHFRMTGQSVTGLEYQAWKFGPVPVRVMEEWEDLEPDLEKAIQIVPETVIDFTRQKVRALVDFDDSAFTPRQLKIMRKLAEQYAKTFSPAMIDVTHAENGAWAKVWREGKGDHGPIPYDLAISSADPYAEDIRAIAKETAAIHRSMRHKNRVESDKTWGSVAG